MGISNKLVEPLKSLLDRNFTQRAFVDRPLSVQREWQNEFFSHLLERERVFLWNLRTSENDLNIRQGARREKKEKKRKTLRYSRVCKSVWENVGKAKQRAIFQSRWGFASMWTKLNKEFQLRWEFVQFDCFHLKLALVSHQANF